MRISNWMRRAKAQMLPTHLRVPAEPQYRDKLMEALEDRVLFSINPSGMEQEMLELINRMRMNPAEELDQIFLSTDSSDPNYFTTSDPDVNAALAFFGVDDATLFSQWATLTEAPPLAWNEALYDAAHDHSDLMIAQDTQAHVLPGEDGLLDRIVDAGYNWSGSVSVSENVFAYTENVFHGHAAFVIDWGNTPTGIQDPAGHRINIMDASKQEVGIAIVADTSSSTSVGPWVVTQDFGNRGNYGDPRALGVVFDDADGDSFYDAGEGLGGVTITISNGTNTYTTTTMSAGGYQVAVAAGTYDVVASGGGLSGNVSMGTITVGTENVKLDLNSDDAPDFGSVAGTVFADANENGNLDSGESGLEGWTVFIDSNSNGNLDSGEQSTTTNSNGTYTFSSVTPGTTAIGVVQQTYYRGDTSQSVSVPAGGSVTADFGQFAYVTFSGDNATAYGTSGNDTFAWMEGSLTLNGNSVSLGTATSVTLMGEGGSDSLTATGSVGDDTATFSGGVLSLTGSGYALSAQGFETIQIQNGGLSGTDKAYLYDTSSNDIFTGNAGSASIVGGGYSTTVFGFDEAYGFAVNGGTDVANLHDGIGTDRFVSGSNYALLRNTGGGFYNYVSNFNQVNAYANNGGNDLATFYDSANDDTFTSSPTEATMTDGTTFTNFATGFDGYYGFSTAGGNDEALFYGGSTDDRFTAQVEYGILLDSAGSYENSAQGFATMRAYASTGYDTASLFDGTTDDQFTGTAANATLAGRAGEFYNYTEGFDAVRAYANNGGTDYANLYDSTDVDRFVATPDYAYLHDNSTTFYNYAENFEQVVGYSTAGGRDRAHLFDSSSNDVFSANPNTASLQDAGGSFLLYTTGFADNIGYAVNGGTDTAYLYDSASNDNFVTGQSYGSMQSASGSYLNFASAFENIFGYSNNGGTDYATMYDSAGNDIFTAYDSYSMMTDVSGSYLHRAHGFSSGVFAYATSGGTDEARMHDSSGNDTGYGRTDYFRLSGSGFWNRAAGFDTVEAFSVNGGSDTLDTDALDYVLNSTGSWNS